MRLGLPRLNSLPKFFLEILPAVVFLAVVGYLLSYVQADRADVKLPPDEIIQSARASELEEVRSDRAMMLDVIKNRRIAEQRSAEQAREAKIAAENTPPLVSPSAEVAPAAATAKETAPLPPVRRVAAAPRSEPATRSEAKNKPQPKPAAEPKLAAAPLPIAPAPTEPVAAPPEPSKGPVMFVVDKAGEFGRKAVATTGEAVAWVVSMPASLMSVKDKIFGESPPPQQNGHILRGS